MISCFYHFNRRVFKPGLYLIWSMAAAAAQQQS